MVGLSKNAGKTTVLNALIRELYPKVSAGLVSIGVDGEDRDAWSGRPKPLITVPEGVVVATAGPLLDLQPGRWEVLMATDIQTTLGQVFIARAKMDTQVKLAGVNSTTAVKEILPRFARIGVSLALVDGAYDRKSSASPFVTDASIAVVGASLSSSLQGVLNAAEEWFHLFTRPVCRDQQLRRACRQAVADRCLYGIVRGRTEKLPFSSLLLAGEHEMLKGKEWEAIAVPGALTDRMLERLMEQKRAVHLIVPDATHLFVSLAALRRFYQWGGRLEVDRAIRLLGVAVNPVSPEGFSFPPEEMREKLAKICAPLPVFDVVRETEGEGGKCDVS